MLNKSYCALVIGGLEAELGSVVEHVMKMITPKIVKVCDALIRRI